MGVEMGAHNQGGYWQAWRNFKTHAQADKLIAYKLWHNCSSYGHNIVSTAQKHNRYE